MQTDRANAAVSTPLNLLIDDQPIESPSPLTAEGTAALLDWMADISHGPNGRGPENDGAAHVLHVLAHRLQNDQDATDLLGILRAAIAHEDEAERRAPCATTALEAARDLERLQKALNDKVDIRSFYALLFGSFPTPIHARYALSILVECRERFEEHLSVLVSAVADRVHSVEGIDVADRLYIDRIRSLLSL
ncbi:MAG: hypothetical protein AAGE94_04285 [Acidobacteriota bacterium]